MSLQRSKHINIISALVQGKEDKKTYAERNLKLSGKQCMLHGIFRLCVSTLLNAYGRLIHLNRRRTLFFVGVVSFQLEPCKSTAKNLYSECNHVSSENYLLLTNASRIPAWLYRVFRAQADWTLTHMSHKDIEQSTVEASITLHGVTLTDSVIR
jgi:hypothetical protein